MQSLSFLISLLVKVAVRFRLRQILQGQSALQSLIVVLLIQCQGQAYRLLATAYPHQKRHCAANYKRYYLYMDRGRFNNQTKLAVDPQGGISIYRSISTALNVKNNRSNENHTKRKRNRNNHNIFPIIALLFGQPVMANTSQTAAPVANSTGSVSNQAVQVLQGNLIETSMVLGLYAKMQCLPLVHL